MIYINKQYTYNGKPVRVYADGSDTWGSRLHIAVLDENGQWLSHSCYESDLIEVWQPEEGELVWAWDNKSFLPSLRMFGRCKTTWDNFAPFTGELPEAFKGFVR